MKEKFNDLKELFRLFKDGKITDLALTQGLMEAVNDANQTMSCEVMLDSCGNDLLIIGLPFYNEKMDRTVMHFIINENNLKNILKPEDAVSLFIDVVGKSQKFIKKISKFTSKTKSHEYELIDVAEVYLDIIESNIELIEDSLGKDIYKRVEHVEDAVEKLRDKIKDNELDSSDVEEELRVSGFVPSSLLKKMHEIVECHKKEVEKEPDKEMTHEKLFGTKEHSNPRMDTLYNRLEELSTNRTKRLEHKQYNEKTGELE